jgi:hypothetical protein
VIEKVFQLEGICSVTEMKVFPSFLGSFNGVVAVLSLIAEPKIGLNCQTLPRSIAQSFFISLSFFNNRENENHGTKL